MSHSQGHRWVTAKCSICGRRIKTRQVSATRPPFLNCCGVCARAAEGLPFAQRTLQSVRATAGVYGTATAAALIPITG